MKLQATKKQMRNGYRAIIGISYCSAQALLNHENAIAYSAGVNGWACDYYTVSGVLISTGYSHLANKNACTSYEMVKDYEDKARAINSDYSKTWEERKEVVRYLLESFVAEATK